MSESVIAAAPDWSLERAAAEMSRRGVRHLVVFDGPDAVGVLSMRDIVQRLDFRGCDLGNVAGLTLLGMPSPGAPRTLSRYCEGFGTVIVSTGRAAPRVFWLRGRR